MFVEIVTSSIFPGNRPQWSFSADVVTYIYYLDHDRTWRNKGEISRTSDEPLCKSLRSVLILEDNWSRFILTSRQNTYQGTSTYSDPCCVVGRLLPRRGTSRILNRIRPLPLSVPSHSNSKLEGVEPAITRLVTCSVTRLTDPITSYLSVNPLGDWFKGK